MDAKISQSLQLPTLIDSEKITRKPSGSPHFLQRCRGQQRHQKLVSCNLQSRKSATWHKPVELKVSCSAQNIPGSLKTESFPASFDETMILRNKSEEIEPYLRGRCIYLVGMMGSGKTTVGRILSEALGYSFIDSDKLIEQAVGETSVAEIFMRHGESVFRENETEVLRKLSSRQRRVISTGGGAVVRCINWTYMSKGISVWLDVPLEALARRIAAVGTDSRPLLHHEPGDAYAKAFKRLSTLLEERGEEYAKANARVSLENIAAKLGYIDVCDISPTAIAIEALIQIENCLRK